MRLVNPSVEIWEQPFGIQGLLQHIEKVGRVCYKSENKITEDSAKPFVEGLIQRKHWAMLEHGTVALTIPWYNVGVYNWFKEYAHKHVISSEPVLRVITNFRAVAEYCSSICPKEIQAAENYSLLDECISFIKRYGINEDLYKYRRTVHFTCDRGISHEFVRHRNMSFAQESTRYCNYGKGKFDRQLTFILPMWFKPWEPVLKSFPEVIETMPDDAHDVDNTMVGDIIKEVTNMASTMYSNEDTNLDYFVAWIKEMAKVEVDYLNLCDEYPAQVIRALLPNSTKTELVVTGLVEDWDHFLDLRSREVTGPAHPEAKLLAGKVLEMFGL